MADGKIKINLSIAGRLYPMTVPAENEEVYREAAKRLNDKVMEYSKIPKSDVSDRLALAAFYFSLIALSSERTTQLGDADIEELHAIEERIRNYIKA
ncbi:MAG: cell division protein ZapA [Alistipes sp.]|jgi:cell division protein ZapA|nr:cell division protein ZapA [Alistipes sp.]